MKKVIKVIVFVLIMIISIGHTYRILSWKDTSGSYFSSTQQLYATEENLMDVVFVGSSHCYAGINPSVLWDEYGISAFDMAVSGQERTPAYYSLKEVLKTQSPKVVCVDLWALFTDKEQVGNSNIYRNMLAMKTSQNSINLVQEYFGNEEYMDYILRWPIVHTRYRELTEYDFYDRDVNTYGRGFYSTYISRPIAPISYEVNESISINEENKKWINDLVKLSEEENFDLILVLIPTTLSVEEQMGMNGVEEYLIDQDIKFINYNKLVNEINLDCNTDFFDETHLNSYGAEKVTLYFGEYLLENYELEDHRGDEEYYLWDECSKYIQHVNFEQELKAPMSLEEYLNKITTFEDLTVIISLDGTYDESALNFREVINILAIKESEYYIGGKWIYENGSIIHYMDSSTIEKYIYDLSENDTLLLQNNTHNLSQISVNGEAKASAYNGLSIVVYDKFTKEIIDVRGYY